MDKSSSAKCLLYSDVVKGEPSPTGRGRRSRDEKGNQGVGDILFTNILQLFSIYFFFSITLLYHFFFYTFFYLRHGGVYMTPGRLSPRSVFTPVPSHGPIFVYMILPQNVMPVRVTPV